MSFLTKDFLYKEYIIENKDAHLIAEENGVHFNTVLNKIKKHKFNIKSRQRIAESLMIKHYQKTGYWWPNQRPDVLEKTLKFKPKYHYNSIKSNKLYCFKSSYELCYALYLDNCDDVKSWKYKDIRIPYIDGETGKTKSYYVDFDVIYLNKQREWIEIKLNQHTIPEDKKLYVINEAKSSNIVFAELTNKIKMDGYKLFLSGYGQERIRFVNPNELLSHKEYVLWFKNRLECCVKHSHYVKYEEVGKYVRCKFVPKRKNKKEPKI